MSADPVAIARELLRCRVVGHPEGGHRLVVEVQANRVTKYAQPVKTIFR